MLVAAVEMVDAVEDGFAVGDEGREDERGGGAKVRAHDGCGLQGAFAADCGRASGDGDVRAHADEFLHMHEAVFEDVFGDGAGAFSLGGEGHVLGLHVGREAGVLFGGDVGGFELAAGADADVVFADVDADTTLFEFGDERAEVLRFSAVDVEVAAGDGAGHEEGSGFDAVGVDAVARSVEFADALDADGAGACAFDFGSHGDEERGEVGDFGLAGAVLEDGLAFGQGGGHEEVFGAGDGDLVEDDVCAFEAVGAGFEVAVVVDDGRAHGFEAGDVQVDGAATAGAASGPGDAGDAGAGDERAEDKRAGAHGLDDLVLGDGVGEDGALDVGAVLSAAVTEFDLGAHAGEELALGLDVADLRDVFEDDLVFGEDGGSHAGEGGVLGSGDFDGAEKGIAATYYKLVH